MPPRDLTIPIGSATLRARVSSPPGACGLVLFAHGSGSGRLSPRNAYVAERLQARGLATVLLDLLTEQEEARDLVTAELRFDIGLLAGRLVEATRWAALQPALGKLPLGYFGASTGAAAALIAATRVPEALAVVSRGGRPDLAAEALSRVRAATLLIVGGADLQVLELNRQAQAQMQCTVSLQIVPHATHLFEEPGALDQVVTLASDWFMRHLCGGAAGQRGRHGGPADGAPPRGGQGPHGSQRH